MRTWVMIGSILACIGVILGAFGAHSLKNILSAQQLAGFKTGVHYQMVHSLALVLVGILAGLVGDPGNKKIHRAGKFLLAGILLFSGSIYGLTLGGPRFLGPLTPIGGLSFMIGWILLALAIPKK